VRIVSSSLLAPERVAWLAAFRVVRHGREMCRYNFAFNAKWQGRHYPIKQVAPVIKAEANELVVITVYTFYF
jgi:hypothetical protein